VVASVQPGGMGGALRQPAGTPGEGCVAAGSANGAGRPHGLGKGKERSGPLGYVGEKE
jgi:hypothetical protein